ncbi:MAG: helix-turn-helix domain-containing protein [Magnetococcus sp. XQGC-1]
MVSAPHTEGLTVVPLVKRQTARSRQGHQATVACAQCELNGFLHLFDGIPLEMAQVFLFRQQPIAKGASLFLTGDDFHGVYAVKEGCIKKFSLSPQGEESISGFALPGELLGLESIHAPHYTSSAIALEDSLVCWLPMRQLELLEERFPLFQQELLNTLASHLTQQQQQFVLPARQTAEARLAAFLLNLAERYARRGLSGQRFRLPMLRMDIANFLGMSMETVSRTLKHFQAAGLLHATGKHIHLLNLPVLQSIAQYTLTCELAPD